LGGQLASKSLDSSEKFALGGAKGVRAYPHGESSADEVCVANVEMRYAIPTS
jgi:hemolysin activation/secretion protein